METKTVRAKFIILVFVGLLTSVFFIQLSSRYLFPSRATEAPLSILFGSLDPKADNNGNATIDIFFSAAEDSTVSEAQVAFTYNKDELDILPMEGEPLSRLCQETGVPLSQLVRVFDAKESGSLVISRKAEGGINGQRLFCWGSIPVRLKEGVEASVFSFHENTEAWEISGSSSFYPVFLNNKSVRISR